ncbi:LysM peptidoglycan-binding domain-containing protein [Rhizobium sp. TRM96647]|uniref:LysM peptidoglycan-binding domain-containing protein n=1 Tax=unclassified Rhizobium TaxID=2613769 RepID=UPI0021E75F35|nr:MULTISPECIES: LysM peptidoglycan-binding domain-containing protein [unclassified Rhizobium]MCV3738482.1 LysM peptidoglycan-binding domain-containing protein [Rhizobium sp. TRM96647]MCV3760169.1 LysM peptidoglycan-binding domain-containing protein [Rhizobium sp. TRM96650]
MKYKTGLIALGVLAAATALMVFFVLPNIDKDKAVEGTQQSAQNDAPATAGAPAATTSEAGTAEAGSAGGKTARSEAPAAEGTADAGTAAQGTPSGDASAWQAPSFDVLRVEPDGSTVVAGRAEPNKTVQILNGETVVATTGVNPSGEFAAVFDKPLAAGDHELTLRVLGEGGSARTSEEVATVSIPKDKGGELLAMVSKPGAASRMITVPEAGSGAAAPAGSATGQDAPSSAAQPSATGAAETAAVAPQTDAQAQAGEAASAGTDATPAPAGDLPAAEGAAPNVRISAVELEGDHMFVAGSTRPGALVRIYANDKLLGEMKADPDGRYVVDGVMPLAVGRHVIRADVMSADAATVELRASVPFDRPEGEQVAVVAQEPAAPSDAPTLGLIDNGSFDKLRAEANKAVGLLGGLYDEGRQPTAEELAAARSATEIALQSLAEYKAPPGSAGEPIAAKTAAVAADALAKLKALPKDAASVGQSVGEISAAVKDALTPATNGDPPPKVAVPVVDITALEARALELGRQFTGLFDAGRNATPADIATARGGLQQALDGIAAYAAPTGTDAARLALVDRLKLWARTAAAALSGVPADAAKEGYADAVAALKAAPEALLSQAQVAAAGNEPAPAPGTASDGGAPVAGDVRPAASETQAAAGQPQTVEQEPLQQSKNSVIIRRGDTLWQIARRVYGQGVRYTTIYLANEGQINNPDRILPGQVFGVPDEAMPEAEAEQIHRKHVKGD